MVPHPRSHSIFITLKTQTTRLEQTVAALSVAESRLADSQRDHDAKLESEVARHAQVLAEKLAEAASEALATQEATVASAVAECTKQMLEQANAERDELQKRLEKHATTRCVVLLCVG